MIGAQAVGMVGILVQTGKYRPGDECKCEEETRRPNYVCKSIVEAVDLIISQAKE